MRKLFKEDLAIFNNGINIGRIDWQNSVGRDIRFIYQDIEGVIKIKQYNHPNLIIEYNGKTEKMHISQFRKCQLGCFLDVFSKSYLYDVGDIINNNIILEQKRVKQGNRTSKGYKYKCLSDGYVGEATEVVMKTSNCPVCNNQKIIKGINDIATTHPHLVKCFVDIEDAYKYSFGSGIKVKLKCPECNNIKKFQISTLSKYGFSCPKCGDGISYPNKFMYNLLCQLNINFEREYNPEWIKPKKYDFYLELNNEKYIIEMDGAWHKKDNKMNGTTIEQAKELDDYKDMMAEKHNIEVIRISSEFSNLEFIKQNISNSKLGILFDLYKIDWLEIEKFTASNLLKRACDLLNQGLTPTEISKEMKISRSTIWIYLNKGSKLHWCTYDNRWYVQENRVRTKVIRSKKLEIFKDGLSLGVFDSCAELERQSEEKFGVKLKASRMSLVCTGKALQHKGYTFKYL